VHHSVVTMKPKQAIAMPDTSMNWLQASSKAVLGLVEARPVLNATDRSTGHEAGDSQQCGSAYVQVCFTACYSDAICLALGLLYT